MNAPDFIDHLEPNQVIVVGTNYEGNHAGGAALYAKERFGLQDGCGEGLSGQTYALPTMDGLVSMQFHVYRPFTFAKFNPSLTFLMTKVGCGIAGHDEETIKGMFKNAPVNILLPKSWSACPRSQRGMNCLGENCDYSCSESTRL